MKKIFALWLSWLYHAGLVLCQASYRLLPFRVRKVRARVISVGNLTWGGTGKTPLVIKLARELSEAGKKVAVLTRGYGQDEVAELKKKLPGVPVVVGRDRVKTARQAIKESGAEFLILDDGFQHLRLHRDLDIVNVSAVEPFGPGGLIPLGTLREPVSHLKRANVVVLTKSNIGARNVPALKKQLGAVNPKALVLEAVHRPVGVWDPISGRHPAIQDLKEKRVATLCAIGDPFSFEKTVEMAGADVVYAGRFEDHHAFERSELEAFVTKARELGAREVVTTEKDWFRLEPHVRARGLGLGFLVLEIDFQLSDEDDLIRRCVNP